VINKKLLGFAIALCVLLSAASAFAAPKVIKVGHSGNAQFPYQIYLEMWGKQIAEATDNRYQLEVYHSDLYGKQNQLIEGCQLGTRDMVMATGSLLTSYSPKIGVLNLPFLFNDSEEAYAVLHGAVGNEFADSLASRNLIVIGWFESGFRHLFPPRPVNHPDDLKGMKLRVVNSAEMIDTINAMGASAVPMGFNDVYSAWQLGTIDGCEGTLTHMITQKYYELTKTSALVGYMYMPGVLIMSKKLWNSIPPADQAIFIEQAKKVSRFSYDNQKSLDAEEIKQCEAQGVVFTRPDKEPFRQAVASVYEKYNSKYGDMLDKILTATGRK
jgi:tripartite ATP-independent transporter DctP family solute receptor